MENSITASYLYKKTNINTLKNILFECITTIDDKLKAAHDNGLNMIKYELPTEFPINNMDKKDSQIFVYSEIIKTYKLSEQLGGKGFEHVFIAKEGNSNFIIIKWLNGMDEEERKDRLDIIKSATIQLNKK